MFSISLGICKEVKVLDHISRFLRSLQTVFHSVCTNLQSHHSAERLLFSTSLPTLVICWCFDNTLLTGLRWYLVVLICIYLMISGIEYLFMYLLTIYRSALENCLFRPSAHFVIRLLWVVWIINIFLILTFYQVYDL